MSTRRHHLVEMQTRYQDVNDCRQRNGSDHMTMLSVVGTSVETGLTRLFFDEQELVLIMHCLISEQKQLKRVLIMHSLNQPNDVQTHPLEYLFAALEMVLFVAIGSVTSEE